MKAWAQKHLETWKCVGLFGLALLPRAYDLPRFVTADEAKWVYRSAQFLAALLRGDLAGTTVNLTPAVTTTWLGSLGLVAYHWLNQLPLPLTDWLLTLPEFRADLPLLVATRWPMVIFCAFSVVVIYLLARRLFDPTLALLAAIFIALDPHAIALSRVLGHDAPTAMMMTISLLLLLAAVQSTPYARRWLLLSGAMAGLAFLSKAPALFLIPFAGLRFYFAHAPASRPRSLLRFVVLPLAYWGLAAYLAFVVGWPAAWIDPLGRPLAVVENAFLSATDEEEAAAEEYWLTPDLGPFYYPVNTLFKLSPLVTVGLLIAVATLRKRDSPDAQNIGWLLLFAVLFALFMTLSDKRSARYILPAFPSLACVAAFGWLRLAALRPARSILVGVLTLSALVILLPYAPYYFTYFNPLAGGPYTAPHLVKIGWGEGLDQVGRFLQREARDSRVGAPYASTIAPFFAGSLSSVTRPHLDYVVLYIKQVQSGQPSPTTIRYFEQLGPIFSVELNGVHYADLYPGPAVEPALALTPGLDHAILPKPLGYRPSTPYGRIGETLEVDVLWLADDPLPAEPAVVTMQPLAAFDFLREENDPHGTPETPRGVTILAEGAGPLTHWADDLVLSRHVLTLPVGLSRGPHALLVDGRPLGEVDLRHFQLPPQMTPTHDFIFGGQIALAGYQFEPGDDYIRVFIAWQSLQSDLSDYTVFVQLLDAETNKRAAGVDSPPLEGQWPTSRWVQGEVVADHYTVALPAGFKPGYYKVIVGLYRPDTGERLTLGDGQDHWTLPWTFIRKEH